MVMDIKCRKYFKTDEKYEYKVLFMTLQFKFLLNRQRRYTQSFHSFQ